MTTTMEERVRIRAQPTVEYFYVYMAMSCVAVALLGFARTYWIPMAEGTFRANPVVHIHGLAFSAWTIFFLYQTWLAASGRLVRHRAMGMIGISFATAITIFGTLVAINQMKSAVALGLADAGRRLRWCRSAAFCSSRSWWRSRSAMYGGRSGTSD